MTIREIAKLANVSPAAVSIVLNDKPGVGPQRRKEIQALLIQNGYQIKSKTCATQRKRQIGFVKCQEKYRYGVDEFSSVILDAIEESANQSGYSVLIVNLSSSNYEQKLSSLDYENLDGMIYFASEISEDCLNFSLQIPLPSVYIDIFSSKKSINTVNVDQREIAYLAAKHLRMLGHRQIGYLKTSPERGHLRHRLPYFRAAMHDLDMQLLPEFLFNFDIFAEDLDEQMRIAFSRVSKFPTAIFSEGDQLAANGLRILKDMGYRIPEDISIISVDNTSISQFITPKLTSIDVNMKELGQLAIERLLLLIENPTRPVLHSYITPFLVRRESSGHAPSRE